MLRVVTALCSEGWEYVKMTTAAPKPSTPLNPEASALALWEAVDNCFA